MVRKMHNRTKGYERKQGGGTGVAPGEGSVDFHGDLRPIKLGLLLVALLALLGLALRLPRLF